MVGPAVVSTVTAVGLITRCVIASGVTIGLTTAAVNAYRKHEIWRWKWLNGKNMTRRLFRNMTNNHKCKLELTVKYNNKHSKYFSITKKYDKETASA